MGIQEIVSHQKAPTLEEIERCQIRQTEAAGDVVTATVQDRPLFRQLSASSVGHTHQPESPNTVLRRTLNIAPPAAADTGQHPSPVGNTFQPVSASALPVLTVTGQFGAARNENSEHLCADVSPVGLITPQALLQTHFTTKVSQSTFLTD